MQRRPWALPLLALAACTAKATEPDPKLWNQACTLLSQHTAALEQDDADSEFDTKEQAEAIESCKLEYTTYPTAVANQSARCLTQLLPRHPTPAVPPPDDYKSCLGAEAQSYFDKRALAIEEVLRLREALDEKLAVTNPPPFESLGITPKPGPWGQAPQVRATTNTPGATLKNQPWDICDAGPDQQFDTIDDVCAGPRFIYFQF